MATKRHPTLARAQAYWRLAAKARRAGQSQQAELYADIGDRLHREWQRGREAIARRLGS